MKFNKIYFLLFFFLTSLSWQQIYGGNDSEALKIGRSFGKGFANGILFSAGLATIGDGFSWVRKLVGLNAQQNVHGLLQGIGVASAFFSFKKNIIFPVRAKPLNFTFSAGLLDEDKPTLFDLIRTPQEYSLKCSIPRFAGFVVGISTSYFLGKRVNDWLNCQSIQWVTTKK